MAEFLPLCDVLFNIISLTVYFCNVVFDVVLSWALFDRGYSSYFALTLLTILISLVITQIVSLRWYLRKQKTEDNNRQIVVATTTSNHQNGTTTMEKKNDEMTEEEKDQLTMYFRYAVVACHLTGIGIFWRYAKLFIPVNLRTVKHEVRDLCILRLLHAFTQAAPMLLLQLHIYISIQQQEYLESIKLEALSNQFTTPFVQESAIVQQSKAFKDLNIVAAGLSLFSICWALASFSKHVRLQNVHRLVLTWLGVIFQFLWRLGTVTSRVASLTVYSSVYGYWILLVIAFHWSSMLIWLFMSKKGLYYGEHISGVRKVVMTILLSFVYNFAYINLQENGHKQKMTTFYTVMFLENCFLVMLWSVGIWINRPEGWYNVPVLVVGSFFFGISFMLVYYRYFHVRRLEYESGGRLPTLEKKKCNHQTNLCKCSESLKNNKKLTSNNCDGLKYPHAIPGVFNCRFTNPVNVSTGRKKKKPTTFVPPPTAPVSGESVGNGPMAIPFWKRALPRSHTGNSSENDTSSMSSRFNIQQKLQEKKQKQLAELKIIEEEIKQGKLTGPKTGTMSSNDDQKTSLPRQPIPRNKKHVDIPPIDWRSTSPDFIQVQDYANITNYDQIYSFGLNSLNTLASLVKNESSSRHASPATVIENNSLTRQMAPKAKMPRNGAIASIYPSTQPPSISPRNTTVNTKKNRPSPCPMVPPFNDTVGNTGSQGRTANTKIHASGGTNICRAKTQTPEILLSPHYLENSRVYYDWMGREHREREQSMYMIAENGRYMNGASSDDENHLEPSGVENAHSDIDSQISLPRSYTLPREFKYYRKNRRQKPLKNNIQSTNSSDGK